jgi:hypothetical protein
MKKMLEHFCCVNIPPVPDGTAPELENSVQCFSLVFLFCQLKSIQKSKNKKLPPVALGW